MFRVYARIIYSSPDKRSLQQSIRTLESTFEKYGSPIHNNFELKKPRGKTRALRNFIIRNKEGSPFSILNSEELATIFHFPTVESMAPGIDWVRSRQEESYSSYTQEAITQPQVQVKQSDIPDDVQDESGGIVFTHSIYQGEKRPVILSREDRRRHAYILGQAGTGKTSLLKNLSYQDIVNGEGICIIDPNGDYVNDILEVIPDHRKEDVIVFNPGDLRRPIGLNMLEYNPDRPQEKTFIVGEVQSIFARLFKDSPEGLGPVFNQYMSNTLYLLLDSMKSDPSTLLEVPRVFTDEDFRKRKLSQCKSISVVDFWEKEAAQVQGDGALENMVPYITSKFSDFLNNDYIRPIIGQTKSSFNFREIMDSKKILLVPLSKGTLGEKSMGLIGMLIVGKLMLAALSRDNIPQEKRKDFYLYIDEFQNFTTDTISIILSEARKYRLDLTIAHQFISQLSDPIREAVFGNVGTLASFRIGAKDAEAMSKEFEGIYTESDFLGIKNLEGIIRPMIDGTPRTPFSFSVEFAPRGTSQVREDVVELSAMKYGRPFEEIEEGIQKRLRG